MWVSTEEENCIRISEGTNDFTMLAKPLKGLLPHSNQDIEIHEYSGREYELRFLFECACNNIKIKFKGEPWDLVLAYAIKINCSPTIQEFIRRNWSECIRTKNLVLLKADSLNIIKREDINVSSINRMVRAEKRTLLRNRSTNIERVEFCDEFWEFWESYNLKRFGSRLTEESLFFFHMFYGTNEKIRLYRYSMDGNTTAYNVLFVDDHDRTVHDMLFLWSMDFSRLRLGVFSIIRNFELAFNLGYSYSLCYGNFEYKRDIMRWFICV